jgi:uncharacterized protein Smg (DUF494 family)
MPDKKTLDYISENLKKGYSPVMLKGRLLQAGHSSQEIDNAFQALGVNLEKQSISNYISTNLKKGNSPEVIKEKLINAGYPRKEIEQELRSLGAVRPALPSAKPSMQLSPQQTQKPSEKKRFFGLLKATPKEKEKKMPPKKPEVKKPKPEKKEIKPQKPKQPKQPSRITRFASRRLKLIIVCDLATAAVAVILMLMYFGHIPIPFYQSTCIEDWSCGGWSPSACPPSGVQIRYCNDMNNCNNMGSIPELSRSCVPSTGGNQIFFVSDFTSFGINASNFSQYDVVIFVNETPYNAYISAGQIDESREIKTSITRAEFISDIFDYNAEIALSLKMLNTGSNEYGDRSFRFEVADLDSEMLLVQNNDWFLQIDCRIVDENFANMLADIFVNRTSG